MKDKNKQEKSSSATMTRNQFIDWLKDIPEDQLLQFCVVDKSRMSILNKSKKRNYPHVKHVIDAASEMLVPDDLDPYNGRYIVMSILSKEWTDPKMSKK